MNVNYLKQRWIKLEHRAVQLIDMMTELEEIDENIEEHTLQCTTVYMMLEQELRMVQEEQRVLEKSGVLQAK